VSNLASDSIFKFQQAEKVVNNNGAFGGVYFLAFVGAAVYFFQQSSTFWEVLVGLFKAAVWPAFIVYEVLKLLQL
jgi:hypothetical protein